MSATAPPPGPLPVPVPQQDVENAEFWAATARGRLLLWRCATCAEVVWYPRSFCPHCGGPATERLEASGRGTVYTYTVVRKSRREGWADAVPYVIARVELEEGPRVLTNLVDCSPDAVCIGMPVEVVFVPAGEGAALYRFRPAPGLATGGATSRTE